MASTDGCVLVSFGQDCNVWLWRVPVATLVESDDSSDNSAASLAIYVEKNAFGAVDHQWDGNLFATAGAQVDIWDHNSFEQEEITVRSARFNPGEPNLLATSASDCSIAIYNLQMSPPARKIIMQTNEDCNCYSFDARKLDEAEYVHQDHVNAVMDIDYSPTGCEFVTGSYDRAVRIFQYNGSHSREIYHTKRMQSCDASYVTSGSDETNLHLWKAKASEQLEVLLPREKKKHEYLEAVKNRYKHLPEVKRIVRHLPKPVYTAATERRGKIEKAAEKEENRRAHGAPGSIPTVPQRKRKFVKEVE